MRRVWFILLLPGAVWGRERMEVKVFPRRPVAGRDVVMEVVVREAKTGKPIEGAVVRLLGGSPGMRVEVEGRTKGNGRIKLPLPARRGGPLVVEVLAVGYEPVRVGIFVKFQEIPLSALLTSLLGFLLLWGGLLFCALRARRASKRQ